jgi:hypothetical protein
MNDNSKLTILSGENLEAGSILSQRDCIEPATPQPIMIQSAKFTSNAISIAHLRIFDFRELRATNAQQVKTLPDLN